MNNKNKKVVLNKMRNKLITKIFVFAFIFSITISLAFIFTNVRVFAEETATTTTQAVTEEFKSTSAKWFEDNLAWFIGIPSGMLLSIIGEAIIVIKKTRTYTKEITENQNQRKDFKEYLSNTKTYINSVGENVSKIKNQVIEIKEKQTLTDDLLNKVNDNFDTYRQETKSLEERIDMLEKMLVLALSKNKEAVSNGVAEQINKLAEEYTKKQQ